MKLRAIAAIPLLCSLMSISCRTDALVECQEAEQHGVFSHEQNNACGCLERSCQPGSVCFRHDCCDDLAGMTDPNRCGCRATCASMEICSRGACVTCDPASPEALHNNYNCGCNGPCPSGSTCRNGECACSDFGKEICGSECRPKSECLCDPKAPPPWAATNVWNCGCSGPCGAGERCVQWQCVCNPLAHQGDNQRCGCGAACDVSQGLSCEGGLCSCNPRFHQTDNRWCGCQREADMSPVVCDVGNGFQCRGGTCVCLPEYHQTDDSFCGCAKNPDGTSKRCDTANHMTCLGGACVCPTRYMTDPSNCGCTGQKCGTGKTCYEGRCL